MLLVLKAEGILQGSASFARELVALANTLGGRILLGVRDDGTAGTGIKRMREAAREQGCPEPAFTEKGFFTVVFFPNPEVRAQIAAPGEEVTPEVTPVTTEATTEVATEVALLTALKGELDRRAQTLLELQRRAFAFLEQDFEIGLLHRRPLLTWRTASRTAARLAGDPISRVALHVYSEITRGFKTHAIIASLRSRSAHVVRQTTLR